VFEPELLSGSSCIRVLSIKPDVDFEAPVEVDVGEIDLDCDFLPFVALSHAWGPDPTLNRILICDGKGQAITGRIDYALRRIRSKSADLEYEHWKCIWIDAVYIDQRPSIEAQLEKSKQVEMMHRIFGPCKRGHR
jgi:Heterokaryon incompatibility protein (HET)